MTLGLDSVRFFVCSKANETKLVIDASLLIKMYHGL